MAKLVFESSFQILREKLFWLLDNVRGRPIGRQYVQVQKFLEGRDNKQRSLETEKNLNSLLAHAIATTPFYQSKVASTSIEGFPVINKTIIKGNFDFFLSRSFKSEDLIPVVTSGSTGTPFKVYHDKGKKNRNYADTLYFGNLVGYRLGCRVLYMKIWVKSRMQSDWKYKLQNIIPIDVIKLSDDSLSKIVSKVERHKYILHSVIGYVSALEELLTYCERVGLKKFPGKFACVITMSESLGEDTRLKLKSLFGCDVFSRYSNLENGIIAQQNSINSNSFLINSASYLVEIFDLEKDSLVEDGVLGRIVVTDLFNFAMPMIRYDTGDLGIKYTAPDGLQYLKKVEGRKLDILLDTAGNVVSSYIMYKNMWQYTEVAQYQLIQVGQKSYEFVINCPTGFKREKKLITEFKSFLGEDAEFKVSYVDEIPLLNSGKRRKTVNLYLQNK